MPYKDQDKRREHDRKRRRAERTGVEKIIQDIGNDNFSSNPEDLPDAPTVQSITKFLARSINRIQRLDGDEVVKARASGYLVNTLLKAIESGEVEARLDAIERIIMEDRNIA